MIEEGDQFLVKNMSKVKKLPGTKTQYKYTGPFVATKVTDTHISYTGNTLKSNKQKYLKVPIHLTKKYFSKIKVNFDTRFICY